MNTKQLLVDREFQASNPDGRITWYTGRENILNKYPSVEYCDFYNTCSSAGDWEGYIVQKIGDIRYLIPFSQVNNYPRGGYTLYTGNVMASWIGQYSPDTVLEIIADIQDNYN